MTWDFYLTLKVGGIAVFVFAGGMAVAKTLGISREKAYFINAVAVFVGFVSSRVWYIVQHYFGSDPYEMSSLLKTWDDAGSVLYGWVIGGTLTLIFLTRKLKIPTVRYLDSVLPWLLVAQCLNRLGCFDVGCCYGSLTTCPVSIIGPDGVNQVHLVQLYEAAFDLLWAWFIWTRPKKIGLPTFLYFTGYPAARFLFEFMRGDNLPALWFMTVPQVTSVVILAFVLASRKKILAA